MKSEDLSPGNEIQRLVLDNCIFVKPLIARFSADCGEYFFMEHKQIYVYVKFLSSKNSQISVIYMHGAGSNLDEGCMPMSFSKTFVGT